MKDGEAMTKLSDEVRRRNRILVTKYFETSRRFVIVSLELKKSSMIEGCRKREDPAVDRDVKPSTRIDYLILLVQLYNTS